MPPAKSYLHCKRLCAPYTKNGKQYIKIEPNSGGEKEVRWYTDEQFEKMYPGVEFERTKLNELHLFGFDEGYITIFAGDLLNEDADRWLRRNVECWRNGIFGWFMPSTYNLPQGMPSCISTITLTWEEAGGKEDHTLKSRDFAQKVADGKRGKELKYCFSPSERQYLSP